MEKLIQIVPKNSEQRLDQFLSSCLGDFSRSYIQKLIKENNVKVNHILITKNKFAIKENDIVEVIVPEIKEITLKPEKMDLDILFEDDDIILINKPKGMVVHPAPGHYEHTLVNGLLYHCHDNLSGINGELRPGIVHRIDKDTTGILIACKTDIAHQSLSKQLSEHSISRKYHAITYNNFKTDFGTIDAPIGRNPKDRKKMSVLENTNSRKGGRRAVTHYVVLDHLDKKFNYLECKLETGRTHQIRVHMSSVGHPILGDIVYGPENPKIKSLEGQTLHANTLGFIHPTKNEYMEFSAPLPSYFVDLLKNIKKNS